MNGFNYKKNLVLNNESKVFKNWEEYGLISKEEFLENLEWVCNDELDEKKQTYKRDSFTHHK